jgi:hypothetical protein
VDLDLTTVLVAHRAVVAVALALLVLLALVCPLLVLVVQAYLHPFLVHQLFMLAEAVVAPQTQEVKALAVLVAVAVVYLVEHQTLEQQTEAVAVEVTSTRQLNPVAQAALAS